MSPDDTIYRQVRKAILVIVGTFALILGIVGIFIPVLPTTPFLLLAAACYAAGSKKVYGWLMANRLFGPHLRNYREGKGMTRNAKAGAISLMWAMMAVSMAFFIDSPMVKVLLALIAIAVSIHIILIKTMKKSII